MIEVDKLVKRYGPRTAVDQATFRVERGKVVGFLGPNGAGKSTTLRMITGFLAPTAGTVKVDGIDVAREPQKAQRRLGYMPEGVPLYPEMRVREYLTYRAQLKGVAGRDVNKMVDRALARASVADAADRIIGQLSKGYRQRVGLADALVADPPLLILDEPTAGLDPNQIRAARDLVKELSENKTVFVSTHILPEVEATCSHVVIIHRGKIVTEGDPASLRRGDSIQVVARLRKVGADPVEALVAAVEGIDGVVEIEDEREVAEGVASARIRVRDRSDEMLDRISGALADAGLAVRELTATGGSLEDLFTQLTTRDDAGEAEPAKADDAEAEEEADDESEDEEETEEEEESKEKESDDEERER